ncbi:hypothetical protein Tco_0890596 [Tanacetum coccineum]|uniref:Retrotransposon gag domain-containing protein n=1 Tax=Tanacetum coccineum TaxID=301880 RepID=A0ABQ5C2D4_9ASTR
MQFARVTKIEFPKFGNEDVKRWMYKCEHFFKVDNVPDDRDVSLISIHLFDIALMWHRQFMRLLSSDIVPWLMYRGAIMQRFGNSLEDHLAELKNCKFETSIEDYQNAYDMLLSRVEILEDQAIGFYMAGLPTDIELVVIKKKNKASLLPTPKFGNYPSGGTYVLGHKCIGQVYMLEVFADEEEFEEGEEIVFSAKEETNHLDQLLTEVP